jgi:hypothetical protein
MINMTRTSRTRTYYIHDNGARNLKVKVTGKLVFIYVCTSSNYESYEPVLNYSTEPIFTFKCKKVFVGREKTGTEAGNSMLLQTEDNDYVHIGTDIYSFRTSEPIVKYVSDVGNNDVPYPYAMTKTKVYFMLHAGYRDGPNYLYSNVADLENALALNDHGPYQNDYYGMMYGSKIPVYPFNIKMLMSRDDINNANINTTIWNKASKARKANKASKARKLSRAKKTKMSKVFKRLRSLLKK